VVPDEKERNVFYVEEHLAATGISTAWNTSPSYGDLKRNDTSSLDKWIERMLAFNLENALAQSIIQKERIGMQDVSKISISD
jgi:hypothetical protein